MATVRGFTLPRIGTARAGALTNKSGVGAGIRIVGDDALILRLRTMGQIAQREMGLILYQASKVIKDTSRDLAPEKTGALKRGHIMEKAGPYTYNVWADTHSETGRDYGGYQEFGYHDRGGNWHEGRRFMRRGTAAGTQVARAKLVALARKLEAV